MIANITNIRRYIVEHFTIKEFVGPRVFKKHGLNSWAFLDPRLLLTMYILRINIKRRITGNTWGKGGRFKERGLRTNLGNIVTRMVRMSILYLSSHVRGTGFDFTVEGMTAEEVRQWIKANAHLFPYKIRLEAGVNWVHLDVDDYPDNPKVYIFKA